MEATKRLNAATGVLSSREHSEPQLVGADEAARYIGLSVWTLRAWAYSGKIASHKISTRLMFNRLDLERIIASSRRPAREGATDH